MKFSLKFRAPLKMTEKERRDINDKMRVYSQDRELEKEFGIKPDTTLYHFETKFQNGFRADLNVCSGQINCWIECVLYNDKGVEVDSVLLEDYLYYSDGTDAMSSMDDITIKYRGAEYRIVVTPKTKEDVIEFENYLKETLSEFDYKQYVNYTEKPIVVTGNIEEIEKAKKLLAEAGIDVTINENLFEEWCISTLKEQFDGNKVYRSRKGLEEIAEKFINTDYIWINFDIDVDNWVQKYIENDVAQKGLPRTRKKIELNKK